MYMTFPNGILWCPNFRFDGIFGTSTSTYKIMDWQYQKIDVKTNHISTDFNVNIYDCFLTKES